VPSSASTAIQCAAGKVGSAACSKPFGLNLQSSASAVIGLCPAVGLTFLFAPGLASRPLGGLAPLRGAWACARCSICCPLVMPLVAASPGDGVWAPAGLLEPMADPLLRLGVESGLCGPWRWRPSTKASLAGTKPVCGWWSQGSMSGLENRPAAMGPCSRPPWRPSPAGDLAMSQQILADGCRGAASLAQRKVVH